MFYAKQEGKESSERGGGGSVSLGTGQWVRGEAEAGKGDCGG